MDVSTPPLPPYTNLDVAGKRVVLRLDLNIEATDIAAIAVDHRVQTALPVLRYLIEKQARVIVLAHRGRPKGTDPTFSNAPLADALARALNHPIQFVPHVIGAAVTTAVAALSNGAVMMTENLRFDAGEEANDESFARQLAALGDVYINDAFANCHRAHASIDAITRFILHAAGPLLLREVETLGAALGTMARPTAAIIGGAKISTKLALLENLIGKMDMLFVGGAMANTFLVAEGCDVQKSLFEPDLVPAASQILARAHTFNCQIILPNDALAAASPNDEPIAVPCSIIPPAHMILDIGPATTMRLVSMLADCRTVVWNGPVGLFEKPAFAGGTMAIARALAEHTRRGHMTSIAGGGDTVAALQAAGVADDFSYISTAGGAFLEFMEGRTLPGLVALTRP